MNPRTFGILTGLLADAVLGDPTRRHPVALYGTAAARLERSLWRDSKTTGIAYTAVCVAPVAAAGVTAARFVRRSTAATAALTSIAVWACLGGRSLHEEARSTARHLTADNLDAARRQITHLCSRNPTTLSAAGIARAAVESVAENTSDAVVAPLLWAAAAGVPGVLTYRAVNTLDAMVGYRNPRYRNFGWAAAKLDDAVNLIPSRVTALIAAACAPTVHGSTTVAARTWLQDRRSHPSPNAGQCEAAFAGALNLRLGGVNDYHGEQELRPTLGSGQPPAAEDVNAAVHLSRVTGLVAGVAAAALSARRTQA